MTTTRMKAPKGASSAFIEGHTYDIPESGIITVISPTHLPSLKRHGFEDYVVEEVTEEDIQAMDDADELVTFIEERGGEADSGMALRKLRRLAVGLLNPSED